MMRPGYVCVWSNSAVGTDGKARRTFRATCGYVHTSLDAARRHLAERIAQGVGGRCDFAVCHLAAVEDAPAKGAGDAR